MSAMLSNTTTANISTDNGAKGKDGASRYASHRHATRRADAVIIGAGIAGLTAAALLAKQGYRVVVIERDVHPGGCAAGFSQQGYRFAVGATVAMGFEAGGIHQQIYHQLGIEPQYVNVRPALRVHLPDRTAWVRTERSAWFEELRRVFPGQDAAKQAFWQDIAKIAAGMYHASQRFPVMPFRHAYDLWDTAKAAHPKMLPVFLNLPRTIAQKLERYSIDDPAHRAFIDGQLLDAMQTTAQDCVATSGALALDIYRFGCQYKIGGLESIAQDLANYVTAKGGEVRYACRAKAILHEDKRVRGVATSRGEVHAPVLISAIPLANTAALLEQPHTSKLSQRAAEQPPMWGAFTLYLGVDEHALPEDVHYYEQITDIGHYHDGGNMLVSISPHWDRSRAPLGKRAITVSTHVDAAKWLEYAQNKEVYHAQKAALETHLLNQLERALPNIRQGIEVMLSGSPRTFYNFTLRQGGTVGGIPQTHAHANFAAPSHRSDIHGLFLAGDTVFPGQGTIGVSVSGYNAARSAARLLARQPSTLSSMPEEALA